MNNSVKLLTITLFITATFVASSAHAHGIWFAQRATQTALIYGLGADDLDTVKRLPLIKSIAGYDANWQPVATELKVAGPILLAVSDGQPAVYAATLDNGIWSNTADGEWLKKGRDEVPDAVLSEKTYKYAVYIRGPVASAVPQLPEQTLQIIPVEKDLPTTMGEPLVLRVMFQNKPAAGAAVKTDFVNDPDATPLIADTDGIVTVKVRNQGLNVIAAIYEGPADDPKKVDRIEHLATLSFVLPHAPE